jgi:hypothetical protein
MSWQIMPMSAGMMAVPVGSTSTRSTRRSVWGRCFAASGDEDAYGSILWQPG